MAARVGIMRRHYGLSIRRTGRIVSRTASAASHAHRRVAASWRIRPLQSWQKRPMPDNLLGRIGDFLQGRRPWYELPRLLAMPQLVEIRNQLRRENLHDTEEPPLEQQGDARRTSIPRCATSARSTAATTTCSSRRWEAAAAGSAATSRSSTRFPDTAEPDDPEPARRQPRADDPRRSFSRRPFSICWRPPGSSSWCTTGSCTSAPRIEDGVEIPLAPGDDWSDAHA